MKNWQFFILASIIFGSPKLPEGRALFLQLAMLIGALIFAYFEVVKK